MTHECAFYLADKALRDVLCHLCAGGSEPVKPVKDAVLKSFAKANYPRKRRARA